MKIKYAIVILASLSITGCGWFDRVTANVTGYSVICVKETGVQYVQFASGVAPLLDKDGKVVPCE